MGKAWRGQDKSKRLSKSQLWEGGEASEMPRRTEHHEYK